MHCRFVCLAHALTTQSTASDAKMGAMVLQRRYTVVTSEDKLGATASLYAELLF